MSAASVVANRLHGRPLGYPDAPELPCPLCRAPTPARLHLPPGACDVRVDPVICDRCWAERRTDIANHLQVAVLWFRLSTIAGRNRA